MIKAKNAVIWIIFLALFFIGVYLSLFYRLSGGIWGFIGQIAGFFGLNSVSSRVLDENGLILSLIRVPAVLKAVVAGSSLALSGMFLQTISKNPLCDPYLTGLSSGAGFGVCVSILFFNSVNYSLFGFFGALLSAAIVISLSGFSKFSVTKLILIGLSLNLFVSSVISFLILTNPEKAYSMTLILTGGFSSADISNRLLAGLFILLILVCAFFVPKLNALRLDSRLVFRDEKSFDGLSVLFIVLAAFLTSLSVFCAGILGFVGIICPLLVKILFGGDNRVLFFGNILVGSVLMLFSNFLSNNLIYPVQIPLGVVVSVIGAPFFVYFLLKKGGIFNA